MKRIFSFLLVFCLVVCSLPMVGFAYDDVDVVEKYTSILAEYDNSKTFDDAVIIDKENIENLETPMVSLKKLCDNANALYEQSATETTGYEIIQFEDRTVFFNDKSGVIDIQKGNEDEIVVLDGTPFYNSKKEIMVPLEEFSNALGYEVFEEQDQYALTRPYQTCRLIVKSNYKVPILDSVDSFRDEKDNITILQFENETDTMAAFDYYSNSKYVDFVEPDGIYSKSELAGVQELSGKHIAQLASEVINIDYLNEYMQSKELDDITVAVIDTGVCSTHSALKGRVTKADVNFSSSDVLDSEDDNGHGTHVIGTIVDNTLNNVNVLAVKALNSDGSGSDYSLYLALKYVALTDAKVVNMSLGRYGDGGIMTEALNELIDKGVTVCVAAGNSSSDSCYYFPARIKECITVGAVTSYSKRPASFSNFGDTVDVVAPGVDINSTNLNNGYVTKSGTSMSTPFVTAVAAMLASSNKNYTPSQIENIITSSSNHSADQYYTSYWNCGYLDCQNMFQNERAKAPISNYESGIYYDKITLELTSIEPNAKIYYTTSGKPASDKNGTLYTQPIELSSVTEINACAYVDGKYRSSQQHLEFTIFKSQSASDDWFNINSSGYITSCRKSSSEYVDVVIPSVINGKTVKGIARDVFLDNTYLNSVVLPDTATGIGLRAFSGCKNLKSVVAKGVNDIDYESFYNCTSLTTFESDSIKSLGESCFYGCSYLYELDLSKVEYIPTYALYKCGLKDLNCKNVKQIGEYGCSNLSSIKILNFEKLEQIDTAAFRACSNVEEIYFPNLKALAPSCFSACSKLASAELNDNITDIPISAFYNCTALKSVSAQNVETIEKQGFYTCSKLETVDFPNLVEVVTDGFIGCGIKNLNTPKLQRVAGEIGFAGTSLYSNSLTYFENLNAPQLEYLYLPNCKNILLKIVAPKIRRVYLPQLETFGKSDTKSYLLSDCKYLLELDLPMLSTINNTNSRVLYYSKSTYNSIRHINIPLIKRGLQNTSYYCNECIEFELTKDLPSTQTGGVLSVEVTGYNLTYNWYYSADNSSFQKLNITNTESYYPTKSGYYYFEAKNFSYKEQTIKSQVCQYVSFDEQMVDVNVSSQNKFVAFVDETPLTVSKNSSGYSLNTKVKAGSKVTLEYVGNNLEAWINSDNKRVSKDNIYTFYATSDVALSSNIKKSSTTSSTVSFYNANGAYISTDKYSKYLKFKQSNYPQNPNLYGHTFVDWDKSVDEINSLLSQGKNVVVTATYKTDEKACTVTVTNGKLTHIDGVAVQGVSSANRFSNATVCANDLAGLEFSHWADNDGNVVSYDKIYSFYVTGDVALRAEYDITPSSIMPTTFITSVEKDAENGKITFACQSSIPISYDVLEQGIILTNNSELNDNEFIIGTNGVLKATASSKANHLAFTVTKKNYDSTQVWRGRSYVIYNADGIIKTVYSPIAY